MLPAMNPGPMTGEGNRTWLISGPRAVLVDAGVGEPAHLEALRRALHDAGAALEHARAHARALRPQCRRPCDSAEWPSRARREVPMAGAGRTIWRSAAEPLGDGQRIPAGDDELVVIHTPGHSPDHICLWHEPSRTLVRRRSAHRRWHGRHPRLPGRTAGRLPALARARARTRPGRGAARARRWTSAPGRPDSRQPRAPEPPGGSRCSKRSSRARPRLRRWPG